MLRKVRLFLLFGWLGRVFRDDIFDIHFTLRPVRVFLGLLPRGLLPLELRVAVELLQTHHAVVREVLHVEGFVGFLDFVEHLAVADVLACVLLGPFLGSADLTW